MKKNILIIDDEKIVLTSIKKILEKEGFEIFLAADADEALSRVKTTEFSLIICDIRLPGQNGIELIKKIRRRLQAAGKDKIPEVLITGYADAERYQEAINLGITDYFHKPFDNKELIEAVKKAIS